MHALGTAGWLAVQALPLLLTPSLATTLLSSDPHRITDLEAHLCRALGLALLGLALLQLLLTGLIPLRAGQRVSFADSSPASASTSSSSGPTARGPYLRASLTVTTIYLALAAGHAYAQLTYRFAFAFAAGLACNSALACIGVWMLLFGEERARVSRSTGADKRTGNFPFENKESAREVKKEKKEREKEKEKERERERGEKERSGGRRSILKSSR